MTETGGGDWREKWQEMDSEGDLIKWAFRAPDGGWVVKIRSSVFLFNDDGRANGIHFHLIPIPPEPVAWSKAADVDPLIDRIRGKNHDEGWFGGIVTAKLNRGLVVLSVMVQDSGENPAPYCRLIPWCDMERHLYTRVGERVWRPTVCEGGK